jgi:adenylosuccinate synthase
LAPAHWIVVGLGFGDEGKGSMVDHLVRRTGTRLVVRFNGGPQAAHHVVTPEGRLHCFAQVGAGSFSPGVETFLAAPMFVEPLALERELGVLEGKGLADIRARVWVDPDCPLVTPYHAWLNRLRELARGGEAHGTCGRGVGEAYADLREGADLRLSDLFRPAALPLRTRRLRDAKLAAMVALRGLCPEPGRCRDVLREAATPEVPGYLIGRYRHFVRDSGVRFCGPELVRDRLAAGRGLVFEGAQGLLLHRDHGFWPHVTPSDTSSRGAHRLLAQAGDPGAVHTLGVVRAYATRHGAGPLVTEEPVLAGRLPEPHNPGGGWQGPMRCGWFDAVATRYALGLDTAVDHVAVTCLDRLDALRELRLCHSYRMPAGEGGGPVVDLGAIAAGPRGVLTERLGRLRPEYLEIPRRGPAGEHALISTMEQLLGRALALVSSGPASGDKCWRC